MTQAMREQLKIEQEGAKSAKETLAFYAEIITKAGNDLMADNSPLPEFRDQVRAKVKEIATQVALGMMTKREGRQAVDKLKDGMAKMMIFVLFRSPTDAGREFADAISRHLYHTMRRDAILRGETVATFNA